MKKNRLTLEPGDILLTGYGLEFKNNTDDTVITFDLPKVLDLTISKYKLIKVKKTVNLNYQEGRNRIHEEDTR